MEKIIYQLNKFYQPALDKIEQIKLLLNSKNLPCSMEFYNNHEIKIKNKFIQEKYPIPVISSKINNIAVDIAVDVATDCDYLGFVDLILSKQDILKFDLIIFNNLQFSIFSDINYQEDLYFGDIEKTKQNIENSQENLFHIEINLKNFEQVLYIINLLEKINEKYSNF